MPWFFFSAADSTGRKLMILLIHCPMTRLLSWIPLTVLSISYTVSPAPVYLLALLSTDHRLWVLCSTRLTKLFTQPSVVEEHSWIARLDSLWRVPMWSRWTVWTTHLSVSNGAQSVAARTGTPKYELLKSSAKPRTTVARWFVRCAAWDRLHSIFVRLRPAPLTYIGKADVGHGMSVLAGSS